MKRGTFIISLIVFVFCSSTNAGTFRERIFPKNGPCLIDQFRCLNDNCVGRRQYCNGIDDCGDNTDEIYCRSNSCPSKYPFFMCRNSNKCIPSSWKCDGVQDCSYSDDEQNCEKREGLSPGGVAVARMKAVEWFHNQTKTRSVANRWGPSAPKISVALYLGDPSFSSIHNSSVETMAYELSIQLLSRIAFKKLKEISTSDLAAFTNALLVTCLDPRKFHSLDIVKELRIRTNAQNYTNPYVLLTLCNAGEKITKKDINKLIDVFWNTHREFWTETQAITVMALTCAGRQPGSNFSLNRLKDLTLELKNKQYRNGTVENLQTTALVMQALFASEPEDDENNFDEEKALSQILREQKEDGSFGNVVNTYYVIPILSHRSLVNISSDHCKPYIKDEETALQDLANRGGSKNRIRFSLWIGDDKYVERTLKLRVPTNSSFYGIMETARDVDSKYRFQYVVKNGKPYINAISGIQDDPEGGIFWFPYIINGTTPSPITKSPADLILKDNDHVIMWYRGGSWIG